MEKGKVTIRLKEPEEQPDFNFICSFTPEVDSVMYPILQQYFEDPLIEGEREVIPNGMVEYRMNLNQEEADMMLGGMVKLGMSPKMDIDVF